MNISKKKETIVITHTMRRIKVKSQWCFRLLTNSHLLVQQFYTFHLHLETTKGQLPVRLNVSFSVPDCDCFFQPLIMNTQRNWGIRNLIKKNFEAEKTINHKSEHCVRMQSIAWTVDFNRANTFIFVFLFSFFLFALNVLLLQMIRNTGCQKQWKI